MRVRSRVTGVLLAATIAVGLTACGNDDEATGAQNVQTVPPATAAASPKDTAAPVGMVVPQAAGVAMATTGQTTAVLGTDGSTVTLHVAPGAMDTPAPKSVRLPVTGLVDLIAAGGGFEAVGPAGLVKIAVDGTVTRVDREIAEPLSLAAYGDKTLVGTARGTIVVLSATGEVVEEIGGFVRVDDILVAPDTADGVDGQVSVLDRAQSAILPVDIETGEHKAALRAGNGATNAVVDQYGRILVTGTRDDQIYAYYGSPIIMRLRYPVGASPYALAYDERRNLLWVSSTSDNQAVAYDLSRGDAVEKGRVATVGQVLAMSVDPASGMLLVLSGRGDGLQAVPATMIHL